MDKSFKEIKEELNESNTEWFRGLLELARSKWDEKEAFGICERYFGFDYANSIADRFNQIRSILHLGMERSHIDLRNAPFK